MDAQINKKLSPKIFDLLKKFYIYKKMTIRKIFYNCFIEEKG